MFGVVCRVACRLLFNPRLGAIGGFSEVIGKLISRSLAFDPGGWFLIGVILGGTVFATAAGGPDFHGYGYLTEHLHGGAPAWIAPILLVCGLLDRLYGAGVAGGCTSNPATG